MKLKNLVLVMFGKDTMVDPKESEVCFQLFTEHSRPTCIGYMTVMVYSSIGSAIGIHRGVTLVFEESILSKFKILNSNWKSFDFKRR